MLLKSGLPLNVIGCHLLQINPIAGTCSAGGLKTAGALSLAGRLEPARALTLAGRLKTAGALTCAGRF